MKFPVFRKRFLSCFIAFISLITYGQQTIIETPVSKEFNNALQLFNNKAYAAAEKSFETIIEGTVYNYTLKSNARYYHALCAIRLNQPEAAKKILRFIEKNPYHLKKNSACLDIANYYFDNKKAAHALQWYQKVTLDLISEETKKELSFKMGYAYLVTENLQKAKKKFLVLINDLKYGNDARYYYGYIAYKLEDYGIAESTLKEIADNESYRGEISYYLLDISFKTGKFERSIDLGKELLKTVQKKQQSDICKIVGESYFNLKKYKEAIPFLKEYKGKKGKWNNTDFYQLGTAYYQQSDFKNAMRYFNKIIDEKNYIAQNAYYRLGECYLHLNEKPAALNAFKTASEMDFNKVVKQDAALNYAKLSYEIGNPFKSVAQVLQNFLQRYPTSKASEEINNLVIASFLHQQDYSGALAFIEQKKTTKNNPIIAEISLYKGMQLFNENKLKEARTFFIRGQKATELLIKEKAKYWEAETLYQLEKYNEALNKFILLKKELKSKLEEFALIDYHIGYCNFNLKKFDKAIIAFESFVKNNPKEKQLKGDAYLRLGDSYFALRDYKKAVLSYTNIPEDKGSGADYAQYQIAMSVGFTGNNKEKIAVLTHIISNYENSNLIDDALFQLAKTYTLINENKKAHRAYNQLTEKYPNSVFLPKVLVRQGLLYYSENQNKKAIEKFKKTTEQFPNSPDAMEAVANARTIYIDTGAIEEYISWINTLKFMKVSNSEIDNTSFAVAEKKYFEAKNADHIISELSKYLDKFPQGIHKLKANYYLADVFFNIKKNKKAVVYYQNILGEELNEFTEEALTKSSQIYLQNKEFEKAILILNRLEKEAYATENIFFAQRNLMRAYYETDAFKLALEYARRILLKDKLETKLTQEAKIMIARSSLKIEDFYTAEKYYTDLEKNASGKLKAETLYHLSLFKNRQKEYIQSNEIVQNLIANYSSHKYWAVKSYVIMGKNYYGLEDVYQATFVLENIMKNFKQFENIVKEAETELKLIKHKEAKINNSVSLEMNETAQKKDLKK